MGLCTSDLIITILVELFMMYDVFAYLAAAVKNPVPPSSPSPPNYVVQ